MEKWEEIMHMKWHHQQQPPSKCSTSERDKGAFFFFLSNVDTSLQVFLMAYFKKCRWMVSSPELEVSQVLSFVVLSHFWMYPSETYGILHDDQLRCSCALSQLLASCSIIATFQSPDMLVVLSQRHTHHISWKMVFPYSHTSNRTLQIDQVSSLGSADGVCSTPPLLSIDCVSVEWESINALSWHQLWHTVLKHFHNNNFTLI